MSTRQGDLALKQVLVGGAVFALLAGVASGGLYGYHAMLALVVIACAISGGIGGSLVGRRYGRPMDGAALGTYWSQMLTAAVVRDLGRPIPSVPLFLAWLFLWAGVTGAGLAWVFMNARARRSRRNGTG